MSALAALLLAAAASAAPTASLLDEGVGARAMAMGGAGAAIARDASALHWNPARLSALERRRETSASHAEVARDTRVQFAGYAQPVEDGWTGLGAVYRDRPGGPAGDVETSDFALTGAYARKEDEGAAGMSVKYLRSRLPGSNANSFATDLGITKGEDGRSTAVVVRNLGPGLRYATQKKDLPLTLVLGFGQEQGTLGWGMDYEYRPRTGAHDVGLGGEWQPSGGLFLRGGWTTKDEKAPALVLSRGFTFGAGVQLKSLRLDYAFRPRAGRFHRFEAGWAF